MMKKAIAIFGAAILAAVSLSACKAEDGRINDNRGYTIMSSQDTYSSRRVVSETSSVVSNRNDNTDTNQGVINDVGSMTGEVINDVADGVDNIGSSVESNVNDFFDGNTDTMQ